MKQINNRLFKFLLSVVLLMNVIALSSCKNNSQLDSSEKSDTSAEVNLNENPPLDTEENVEVEVGTDEDVESFGE